MGNITCMQVELNLALCATCTFNAGTARPRAAVAFDLGPRTLHAARCTLHASYSTHMGRIDTIYTSSVS